MRMRTADKVEKAAAFWYSYFLDNNYFRDNKQKAA